MKYYSTNHKSEPVSLKDAVIKGLAPDRGLYMPEKIQHLPQSFFSNMGNMNFIDIALEVAKAMFGEDIPEEELRNIVQDTLTFDCPMQEVEHDIYALELFHGPTLAFKDVGARFMARMLSYFIKDDNRGMVNVLVATSGDTGSAVANGFLGVPGIHVYVLYPKDKVSEIQECQFTTLGQNITALEIEGNFDDCQALVKNAFMDSELNEKMMLTSANSINVARLLPQAFYYFWAYAQLQRMGTAHDVVACVPSGNFGNITAALIAHRMGLPIKRFIAANNANDVFLEYLNCGVYRPRASVQTIANAMDVGAPSNFYRILEIFGHSHKAIKQLIHSVAFDDTEIRKTISDCYKRTGYILDPHGACGYAALKQSLRPGETGFFGETAHPAKFKDIVESVIGANVAIPDRLAAFMKGKKQSVSMSKDFDSFKTYLKEVSLDEIDSKN